MESCSFPLTFKTFLSKSPKFSVCNVGRDMHYWVTQMEEKVVVQVRGVCRVSQASTSALAAVQAPLQTKLSVTHRYLTLWRLDVKLRRQQM